MAKSKKSKKSAAKPKKSTGVKSRASAKKVSSVQPVKTTTKSAQVSTLPKVWYRRPLFVVSGVVLLLSLFWFSNFSAEQPQADLPGGSILKVEPAVGEPADVAEFLQDAQGNTQQSIDSGLHQPQSQDELQPNAKTDSFTEPDTIQ